MIRLIKAEVDLSDAMKELKELFQCVNFLRFQNAAIVVHCVVVMKKIIKVKRNRVSHSLRSDSDR